MFTKEFPHLLPISRILALASCLLAALPCLVTKSLADAPALAGVHLTAEAISKDAPAYSGSQQAIFWVSGDANPGDTVLVSGAFTASPKSVDVAMIPSGTNDWKQLFKQAAIKSVVHNLDAVSLSFTIPAELPKGVYAFRISDGSSSVLYGRVNVPRIFWTLGMNQTVSPSNVEAGKTLRVFGADFPEGARIFLTSASNRQSLLPKSQDRNSLSVNVPASLPPGNYSLQVGTDSAPDGASSATVSLSVGRPGSQNLPGARAVSCPGLAGNGGFDVTASLQACLDANASDSGSVQFKLAPGTYAISRTISLHPHQYLEGAGTDKTIIVGRSSTIPRAWIEGANYFGLSNLAVQGEMSQSIISSKDLFAKDDFSIGDSRISGHILLTGVHIVALRSASMSRSMVTAVQLSGPDIQFLNSTIDSTEMNEDVTTQAYPNVGLIIVKGNGGVLSGLQIKLGNKGEGIASQSSRNMIIERNTVDGSASTSFACGIGVGVGKEGPSENIYVASNTFRGFKGNIKEGITTDGGGGVYLGHIQGATGVQLTLSDDPDWSLSSGHTEGFVVSIISGTGSGQYRFIQGVSGRNMNLDRPWDLAPDQKSTVDITPYQQHIVITQNTVSDFVPGIQFYGMAFDSLIKDNQLQDTSGIVLRTLRYNRGTGLPVIDVQVTGNQISGRPAALNDKEISGIALKNTSYDGFISGVLLRNNRVDSRSVISTDQTAVRPPEGLLFDKNDANLTPATANDYKPSVVPH